jgi:polar amino acid transport system substrate-binding protein
MVKKILIISLILCVAVVGFAFAGSSDAGKEEGGQHIVIATDATWPPMEFVDASSKKIVGFDIDLMAEIAKAGGFSYEFKNTAWDGIFAGLSSGKYDAVMSSVTITEERKKEMDFSKPYINAGQVLIVPNETKGVEELADLRGKTVGAQIGTTGSFEVEKVGGITLKSYDEIGLAFEDLVNGRIDGVVADTPVAADFALQNKTYKGKLKIVGDSFTDEYYGIAVKKGNTKVLEALNRGIDKVVGKAAYEKVEDKWLR